jgi:hypothetical protein
MGGGGRLVLCGTCITHMEGGRGQVDPQSSFVDPKSCFVDPKSSFVDPKSSFVDPKSSLDV